VTPSRDEPGRKPLPVLDIPGLPRPSLRPENRPTETLAASVGLVGAVAPPVNPPAPGRVLGPFQAVLSPIQARRLVPGVVHDIDMAQTMATIHPDLPAVPVWGFGLDGVVSSPGPLLEVGVGSPVQIRWRNRLPGSRYPLDPHRAVPRLPFATTVLDDPTGDTGSVQNELGDQGGPPHLLDGAPIGWTSVHVHGAHNASDGWPDNMKPAGGEQLSDYANSYDNLDLGLGKVGAFLWYHDHALDAAPFHLFAGLAGGYLVRDPREAALGLPTSAGDGEIVLLVQDRNLAVVNGELRMLHKTTTDTPEFFGPLTLVNGLLWPRMALRPEVYRIRLLNGSNARTYRLHLVAVRVAADGAVEVIPQHDQVRIIGTDGGLLWRTAELGHLDALTLAPAERVDVLVDLTGINDGSELFLVNSAQAPFGGDPAPALADLLTTGDLPGRNPYPWVLRLDVHRAAANPGRPKDVFDRFVGSAAPELNPAFARLVHEPTEQPPPGFPRELSIRGQEDRIILLGEAMPGQLFLQDITPDPGGGVALQLPGAAEVARYRVNGFLAVDPTPSDQRVAFYQVFTLVNTTGDTHTVTIHQAHFQPLGDAADRLVFADADDENVYDPLTRTCSAPLVLDTALAGRRYDASERFGWRELIRVDPGNVVRVAMRFDIPGRYAYHCHATTKLMRPLVVTVAPMDDGGWSMMRPFVVPDEAAHRQVAGMGFDPLNETTAGIESVTVGPDISPAEAFQQSPRIEEPTERSHMPVAEDESAEALPDPVDTETDESRIQGEALRATERVFQAELEDHAAGEPLEVGTGYTIAFSVADVAGPAALASSWVSDTLLSPSDNDAATAELTVQVDSNDFALVSEHTRRLLVPRTGRSLNKARFDVVPLREGPAELTATLHSDGNFVHQLHLTLPVGRGSGGRVESRSIGRPVSAVQARGPRDLTMVVQPSPADGYDCLVIRRGLAHLPITSIELASAIKLARADLLRVVNYRHDGRAPFLDQLDIPDVVEREALRTLARAGATLFNKLFDHPRSTADARELGGWLRETATDPRRRLQIQVVSDQAPLPWPLLYLGDASDGATLDWDLFLGMRHVIERLPIQMPGLDNEIPSDRPQLSVSLNLHSGIDEQMRADYVARQQGWWTSTSTSRPRIHVTARTTRAEVLAALKDESTDDRIFYLYCHGHSSDVTDDEGPDASYLEFEDGLLVLRDLKLDAPMRRQLQGRPLVFINACDSASMSSTFYDGFVPYFIAKGARGVIGTECEIPAMFAAEWARAFFDRFLDGEPLGDIVLALRRRFLAEHRNPLGLLYAVHCDSQTVITPALRAV
jgi:FtsP/CotA-like multicopper oxidase with cupredoxin domain